MAPKRSKTNSVEIRYAESFQDPSSLYETKRARMSIFGAEDVTPAPISNAVDENGMIVLTSDEDVKARVDESRRQLNERRVTCIFLMSELDSALSSSKSTTPIVELSSQTHQMDFVRRLEVQLERPPALDEIRAFLMWASRVTGVYLFLNGSSLDKYSVYASWNTKYRQTEALAMLNDSLQKNERLYEDSIEFDKMLDVFKTFHEKANGKTYVVPHFRDLWRHVKPAERCERLILDFIPWLIENSNLDVRYEPLDGALTVFSNGTLFTDL